MAQTPRRSMAGWMRDWPLWTVPAGLRWWVGAVVALAAAAGVVSGLTAPFRLGQLVTWLMLTGCGAVCVEAVRRVGEPAGVSKDLLSAWTLPVALLLPAVYSLAAAVVLTVLSQLRVSRGPVYRRTLSAAAIGLANAAVSVVFHHYVGWAAVHVPGGRRVDRTVILAVALGCAGVGSAVNVILVGQAVRLADPGTTWRELAGDREKTVLDVGEISLGIAVTGCWFLTPALAVLMLGPVLLVQRGLTHAQLLAAARIDAKTGLLNAKAWQEEADREITRGQRDHRPVAVLIADIDHFKQVNDTHGHLAGDVALMAVVSALLGGLRPYDQLGRFGGEEFTVVLPGAGREEAGRIAERLRRAVAATPVLLDETLVEVSVSVGVAVLGQHGHDLTDLLTAADHALYRAKQAGRNQVALAL